MRMLELGCGDNPRFRDGYEYFGIDKVDTGKQTHIVNLGFESLPFPDNYFDFICGYQFLEHIPRNAFRLKTNYLTSFSVPSNYLEGFNPLISLLNEIWRVARPGAEIEFHVPHWAKQEQWQDPTHVNPCPPNMWKYWTPEDEWNLKKSYGILGSFKLSATSDLGWYLIYKLEAIK